MIIDQSDKKNQSYWPSSPISRHLLSAASLEANHTSASTLNHHKHHHRHPLRRNHQSPANGEWHKISFLSNCICSTSIHSKDLLWIQVNRHQSSAYKIIINIGMLTKIAIWYSGKEGNISWADWWNQTSSRWWWWGCLCMFSHWDKVMLQDRTRKIRTTRRLVRRRIWTLALFSRMSMFTQDAPTFLAFHGSRILHQSDMQEICRKHSFQIFRINSKYFRPLRELRGQYSLNIILW